MRKKILAMFMSVLVVLVSVYYAQALQITFNPESVNATESSAIIEWQTDESANSSLTYWSVSNATPVEISDSAMNTTHSFELTGLMPATTYNYWLSSSTQGETAVMNNSGSFYQFTTKNISIPVFINATIPQFYHSARLNIRGKTSPNALVHAYANPEPGEIGVAFYDVETFADSEGNFTIYGLILDSSLQYNTVVLWARDLAGNTAMLSGNVELDLSPPNIALEFPDSTQTGTLKIKGTTDETIAVEIYAAAYVNDTAPELNESNLVINETVTASSLTPFSFSVSMPGDKNLVRFDARDKGGNLVRETKTVISDTIPPSFLYPTSLEQYSPSYVFDVVIEGNISEEANVTAFVNGVKQDTVSTDEKGKFKITVTIEKASVTLVNETYYEKSYGSFINQTYIETYPNYVTLMATDKVGNTQNLTGIITYSPCGFGTWWNVNEGMGMEVMPDILSPQMLLDGTAQLSFSFKLDWQGFGNYSYVNPRVTLIPLNIKYHDFYDSDWASISAPTLSMDRTKGYVTVNLKAPDPTPLGENWTYQEKLKNISEHRMTDQVPQKLQHYSCSVPHVGCVKLPLMLEIEFESDTYNGTQKVCNYVEVTIDNSFLTMQDIPDEYLKKMIGLLDFLINTTEPIVNVTKQAELVLVYTYFASVVAFFVYKVNEFLNCRFSTMFMKKFTLDDANFGCPDKGTKFDGYTQGENYDQETCKQCANAIEATRKFQYYQNWLGDRLFMPSIPTLQKYVKDNWNNKYSWCYGGTGAAAGSLSTFPTLAPEDYINMAKDKSKNPDEECPILHLPPQDKEKLIKCCGIEYNRQWRSGCAFLDPLQESACEADQANYAITGNKLIADTGIKCHPLWNAAAGFCDPQGGYLPDYVATPWAWPAGAFVGQGTVPITT